MNAIQAFVPPKIVKTIAAFLEFCYIARHNIISDDSLEQLKGALHRFHESRQIFLGTVRAHGPSAFSLPRQHSMVHYYDHIKNFGSPNGLCSSITESKHIIAVKRPWRRSNKHMALPQILKVNERLDKVAAARANFTTRGMLADTCLIQALNDISNDLMDEDAGNSDDSDGELSDEMINENEEMTGNGDETTNNIDEEATNDVNEETTGNNNEEMTEDAENPPYIHRQLSPAPPDEEDDDYGPVESGPLMNEVRLIGRKGQSLILQVMQKLKHCSQRPHGNIPRHSMRSV